jgi:hypothetical protein
MVERKGATILVEACKEKGTPQPTSLPAEPREKVKKQVDRGIW